jgi:hypothetical protein
MQVHKKRLFRRGALPTTIQFIKEQIGIEKK